MSMDAVAASDRKGLCGRIVDLVSLLSTAGVPRSLLYIAGKVGLLSDTADGNASYHTRLIKRSGNWPTDRS